MYPWAKDYFWFWDVSQSNVSCSIYKYSWLSLFKISDFLFYGGLIFSYQDFLMLLPILSWDLFTMCQVGKWGRRRQYIFVGALITGASFIAMWQMYELNGPIYNFWYFLSFSFLFYLGITPFGVPPYVAMGYEMSGDFHERRQLWQWLNG